MRIGRLARCYRWIEYAAFGRALERIRFVHLDRLRTARRVLILGEGDGRALERLLTIAPAAHFDVYDVSPEMIALAEARSRNQDRVRFKCADARSVVWPTEHYDAIVTQFFLDCFTENEARTLVDRLAATLAPSGKWLIADFAIPSSGWRRIHAQLWIRTMYLFFGLTTGLKARNLPPFQALLNEAGLHPIEHASARAGLMDSTVWSR